MTRCAQMLSEVFKGRRDGLVEKIIIDNSRPTSNRRRDTERAALLSPENPCGLTRAEWRLCVLVANGLSRARVAKELGITENTIRSHLRNIYSKTELETFHELALHMTSEAEQCHLSHLSVVEAA